MYTANRKIIRHWPMLQAVENQNYLWLILNNFNNVIKLCKRHQIGYCIYVNYTNSKLKMFTTYTYDLFNMLFKFKTIKFLLISIYQNFNALLLQEQKIKNRIGKMLKK